MLQIGQVVWARAGRDKDHYFVVLDCDGPFAYIADGRRRKKEKPKKKKIIHLRPTLTIESSERIATNREIRKVLRPFEGENV